ncbi:MAG: hypothetical protein FWG39_00110 [Alphaproteobacteria bacterium]|nr:hypothetical protein [Alphaproteobacteria bacterium]
MIKKYIVFDGHIHAREPGTPEFLKSMPTYGLYSGGVYMMNFPNPLELYDVNADVKFCHEYAASIHGAAAGVGNYEHIALIMPVLNNQMTAKSLESFITLAQKQNLPLAGFKLFTQGQSTNSGYAPDIKHAQTLIDVVQAANLPLALHMEDPDEADTSKKEESAFRRVLPQFIEKDGKQRNMKISVEHISTEYGLRECFNHGLWCTITPHHLAFSQEQLGIDLPATAEAMLTKLWPYYFCKPIIQTEKNRAALLKFWMDCKYSRMMLGSDSAPHQVEKKRTASPAAGIFMGDIRRAYQYAAGQEVYHQIMEYSMHAANFYGLDFDALSSAKFIPEKDDGDAPVVMNVRRLAEQQFGKTM